MNENVYASNYRKRRARGVAMPRRDAAISNVRVAIAIACMTLSLLVLDDGLYVTLAEGHPFLRDIGTLFGVFVMAAFAAFAWFRPNLFRYRFWSVVALSSIGVYLMCGLVGLRLDNSALLLLAVLANSLADSWLYLLVYLAVSTVEERVRFPLAAGAFAAAYGVETALGSLFASLPPVADCCLLLCIWISIGPLVRDDIGRLAASEPEADLSIVNPRSFLPWGHLCFITVLVFDFAQGVSLSISPLVSSPWLYEFAFLVLFVLGALALLLGHRFNADAMFVASAIITLAGMIVATNAIVSLDGVRLIVSRALLSSGSACFNLLVLLVVASIASRNWRSAAFAASYVIALSWLGLELGAAFGNVGSIALGSSHDAAYWIGVSVAVLFAAFCMVVLLRFSFVKAIEGVEPIPDVHAANILLPDSGPLEHHSVSQTNKTGEAHGVDGGGVPHKGAEGLSGPASPGDAAAGEEAAGEEVAQGLPHSFLERCDALASRYGLTRRESEVFRLLACGRTLRVIKDKLVISPNTVRFHTKNIYAKLGVHSQQELIDIVEAGGREASAEE